MPSPLPIRAPRLSVGAPSAGGATRLVADARATAAGRRLVRRRREGLVPDTRVGSRAMLVVAVALVVAAASSSRADPGRADPVRIAVVGFAGDMPGPALTDLASNVRGSMSRQADPKALIVVSREEMAAVYQQRGGACRPDDMQCVIEASDAWAGRLFVRGVVRTTSEGVIIGATLESVRGMLVAAAQTPPVNMRDLGTSVPILVRDLLNGERAYRERVQKSAPPLVASADGAPAPPPGPVHCKCLAILSTYVAGELVADDAGLRFDAAPTSAVKVQWRYAWDHVGKIEPASHGVNPALSLASTSNDAIVVYFNLGNDRDKCLAGINGKRRR